MHFQRRFDDLGFKIGYAAPATLAMSWLPKGPDERRKSAVGAIVGFHASALHQQRVDCVTPGFARLYA